MPGFVKEQDSAAKRDLRRRIHAFLAQSGFPSLRYVSVEVTDGAVLITGLVATYYAKQLAQEYVRRVAGVRRVVNRITVGTVIDSEGPFDPATDLLLTFPADQDAA